MQSLKRVLGNLLVVLGLCSFALAFWTYPVRVRGFGFGNSSIRYMYPNWRISALTLAVIGAMLVVSHEVVPL